jgi:hypothetical protein
MHRIRKLKYYQTRAAQIRSALMQNGLDPQYRRDLQSALFLAEWRIRKYLKMDDSYKPHLN